MSFDWLQFLDLAILLSDNMPASWPDEAVYRTAVSRAYYAAYNEALVQNPGHVMAHVNRGVVLNRLNRPEEALAAYERALELQPTNADAHCNRGNLLKELGRTDEALQAYDKALKLQPDDLRAGNNRATVLGDIGRVIS